MHSMINDGNLRDFSVLLISELHVWTDDEGRAISTPTAHNDWTKTESTISNITSQDISTLLSHQLNPLKV